ncbi:TPA: transposase [Candidatus Ventrenecus stercoripullorum]|nr:transposase [Candidatus Ventrenecus stercoripullorum]
MEKLYRKLKNARKKYLEEVVSKILKGKEIILAERLKVRKMLSKENNPKNVRKSISNVSFQTILQTIEYKCKWSGRLFHQISTYYPSSQICSECGHKDTIMKDYRKREYICPVCKIKIERDYNASRNILQEGLRELKIA